MRWYHDEKFFLLFISLRNDFKKQCLSGRQDRDATKRDAHRALIPNLVLSVFFILNILLNIFQ